MGHGPATFKETDLTRALRAARKAGADVERVEIGRDGRIVLVLKNNDEVSAKGNEWDEWRTSS
jgi:ATP-dependent exoDNAse (exonuclease V) alpha subunit